MRAVNDIEALHHRQRMSEHVYAAYVATSAATNGGDAFTQMQSIMSDLQRDPNAEPELADDEQQREMLAAMMSGGGGVSFERVQVSATETN